MESTAFNHAAWNPLHSIGMHFTRLPGIHAFITLHGLHCIQSGCFAPYCMKSTAFNHAPWNPLHSIMLHNIHCIQNVPFLHAAWNPLHSIGMHVPTLHGVHCIQSKCMESTAFNRDALGHAAYNPLHSIG